MVFQLRFVQVSCFGAYADGAGCQSLIQISLKCRGSRASEMACRSLQLQRDSSRRRSRRGESLICKEASGRERNTRNPPKMLAR